MFPKILDSIWRVTKVRHFLKNSWDLTFSREFLGIISQGCQEGIPLRWAWSLTWDSFDMKRDLSFVYTIPEIFLFRHENFSGLVSAETTQKWNNSCTASLHNRSSLVPGSGTETRRRQGHPMCDNLLCSPRYRNHAEICSLLTDFMPSYPKKNLEIFRQLKDNWAYIKFSVSPSYQSEIL